jgi:hypothetical protein
LRLAAAPWPPLFTAAASGSLTAALVLALAGWGIWEEWWIATQCIAISAVIAMGRAATEPQKAIPPPRRGWRAGGR